MGWDEMIPIVAREWPTARRPIVFSIKSSQNDIVNRQCSILYRTFHSSAFESCYVLFVRYEYVDASAHPRT